MGETPDVTVNRAYKDTLFRKIFNDPEKLLSLYNAINGTCYTQSEDLRIVTLENAVYMNMKNDLAFIVDLRLNLYEHQSTVNPNMPLRFLLYIAREYEMLTIKKSLYASRLIRIPTPRFVIFYNGSRNQPQKQTMKLSDAFEIPEDYPSLELLVTMFNINYGHHAEVLEQCQLLKEYMQYVERVRIYRAELPIREAVERAVKECIEEGILAEYLEKNRAEAVSMSIFEYDEEREIALIREDEYQQGMEDGICQGIKDGIQQGIQAFITGCREFQITKEEVEQKIREKFSLDIITAEAYMRKYWK